MLIASEPDSGGENITIGRIRKKKVLRLCISTLTTLFCWSLLLFLRLRFSFYSTLHCNLFIVREFSTPKLSMSSMRNAVQRRNHKERGQIQGREKWGLLEKHKVSSSGEGFGITIDDPDFSFMPTIQTNVLTSTGLLAPCQRLQCQEG